MKKENLVKILLPIIAVIIVIESIVLVSHLNKGEEVSLETGNNQVAEVTPVESSVIDLLLEADETEMKVGSSYEVSLDMVTKDDRNLDGIDLFIKYDPEMVDISNLVFENENLSKPDFSKASTLKSVVVATFLIPGSDGLLFKGGEVNDLIAFTVTPKKEGSHVFEVSTGNESKESATMFVENSTGKNLNFSSNKLEVNFVK